ncbi:hypothetical protein FSARC_8917 [Fusarium sarcochroum]|uniref:DUF6546 domain-containing protein n=1 Tax=Fusarium sarcochroum TaxID=1208366 RepID=A0A8H4TSF4_9HYPO|nr:hypothetical protein FSARC_8917 [Fusarium sarcochroum]
MKTRSMKRRAEAPTWASLPLEIRHIILDEIAHRKHPGWGRLASVCREWQDFIEKVTFSKIKLKLSCLDESKKIIVGQKRMLVHNICLNIELPEYETISSTTYVLRSEGGLTNISEGIRKLWCILSDWEPAVNLTLELNVYSPSDCQHWFKNIYLFSDDIDDVEDIVPDAWKTGKRPHDPKHGWVHGRQVKDPPTTAKIRLFRHLSLSFAKSLPQVPAVTSFVMRRQLRRYVSSELLGKLLNTLDRLEHISFEPWTTVVLWDGSHRASGLASMFQKCIPRTLNRLIIFEDSYEFYDPFAKSLPSSFVLSWVPGLDTADDYGKLGEALASKSRDLQHLAISFMIDAERIFRFCQPTWTWSHLESLALTSQLLQNHSGKYQEIWALLCRARAVVQKMSKLHTFVLWNGGKGHACAFICRLDKDSASVTWRGTWRLELSPAVLKSWQRIASELRAPRLQVNYEQVAGVIKTHGDAIYRLKLPCQVVEPASLADPERRV